MEADPFAYALRGFSLHVAGVIGSFRLSMSALGIDVPRFLHGNDDWSVSMRGAGIKMDLLGRRIARFFVGANANYFRMAYTLEETGRRDERDELGLGARVGFQLALGRSGLYLAPWMGVGYTFSDGDVEIADRVFEHTPITIFPTVHIGWRF